MTNSNSLDNNGIIDIDADGQIYEGLPESALVLLEELVKTDPVIQLAKKIDYGSVHLTIRAKQVVRKKIEITI